MASRTISDLSDLSNTALVAYAAVSALIFVISYWSLFKRKPFDEKAPPVVRSDWPIVGALGFWTARRDWWNAVIAQTGSPDFSFHIGKHRLVGVNSDEGRKVFFESKEVGFAEGYAVLFGQAPDFADSNAKPNSEGGSNRFFNRRMMSLLKNDRFAVALPTLLSDVRGRLNDLAVESPGITDPFDSIYKLVYLLTQRAVGANEIARDRKLMDTTLSLFEMIEQSAKPYQVIIPWLPSLALVKRFYAGMRMYMIFERLVKARQKGGTREDDPLQYLIDEGDDTKTIISFVVGALFAGQLNSGINAAWVLCYLAVNPYWLNEVRKEVRATTDKYCPGNEPLIDRLGKLPLEAWEQSFPLIDLCLRDSIRLQAHGTGFRKNMSGRPLKLGDKELPADGFLVYHFGNHHLNPELFRDPHKWDPSRYFPDRAEDKKDKYAFIGWGAGRHPCLGMRFAKLEQNIITAFFCTMFDFELVDSQGRKMEDTVKVNTNNYQAARPDTNMFIKYTLRQDAIMAPQ
ncbi:hypothetical protein, variant [Verruconis gallopava]|uniref:Cytochrome P450 6A1 n=1 Tax=Verruconis gallopava TaxID=253628 RepID=A0A0D2AN23_9PEZI|nr:uncharacterized protein PV09_01049 [Verruconis gallopava]XP_016217982.1 hypothetical protein, variant [Verruconis gallopava]KIW08112.1 hypothetical protein PV09_01049 [Verruconis gallopava]KIW08113.1 hypothetical protein, variant [Verruconis gallopava]